MGGWLEKLKLRLTSAKVEVEFEAELLIFYLIFFPCLAMWVGGMDGGGEGGGLGSPKKDYVMFEWLHDELKKNCIINQLLYI